MGYYCNYILKHKNYKNPLIHSLIKIFVYFLFIIPQITSLSSEINVAPFTYSSEFFKNRKLSTQNVYGNSFHLYYYYINLYLGEKMQKQGFLLNTDNEITTSTCSLCEHCGKHIDPYYDVKSNDEIILCSDEKCNEVKSSNDCNNKSSNCSLTVNYSEDSKIEGVYINELIRFGQKYKSQNGTFIPIGCSIKETNKFYKQNANGIIGLGNSNNNFVELLYKYGAIKNNIFSLCLAKIRGIFNMGEINHKTHKENISFVPMINNGERNYKIEVNSIYVNREVVTKKQYIFSLNSGISFTEFNIELYNEILNVIEKECKKFNKTNACGQYKYNLDYGLCFNFNNFEELDYSVNNYWPKIHFFIYGYNYEWDTRKNSFTIYDKKNPYCSCMGILKSKYDRNIFGVNWFIDHDIIFDRKHGLIGFAEAECNLKQEEIKTNEPQSIVKNETNNTNKNIFNKNVNIKENKTTLINNIIIKNGQDKTNNAQKGVYYGILIFALILLILMILFIIIIIYKHIKNKNVVFPLKLESLENIGIHKSTDKIKITHTDNRINDSSDFIQGSIESISSN